MVAAHFNHGKRGDQSDADQGFVESLCRQFSLPCVSGRSPTSRSDDTESAMRTNRYDFLLEAAEEVGARYLVTAHTADDQAETIVHRIIRGTGLAGLSGIPRVRRLSRAVSAMRPMLSIRREQVLAYLRRMDQPYREDASNDDVKYTRNRIRHELLPRLEADYNQGVVDALLRLGQLAGEAQQVIFDQVDALMDACVSETSAGCVRVDSSRIATSHPFLVRALFIRIWGDRGWPQQAMGFEHWELLCRMARGTATVPGQRATLPGAVDVQRSDGILSLQPPGQGGPRPTGSEP